MDLADRVNKKEATPVLIILIVIFGIFTFANMIGNSFVWDDEEMVVNNFTFFKIENIPRLFTQATFFSGGSELSGWFYRPVVMLSFLLVAVFFGQTPFGFHFVQLALHTANAVLLFFIFTTVFTKVSKELARPAALFLSLVFVVNPAHVESVSYIASMAEPLYTFLLLVLFLLLVKEEKLQLNVKAGILAVLLFTLALLTKEGAIVFLPLAGLYLFLFKEKEKTIFWAKYLLSALGLYLFARLAFFGIQFQKPSFLSPIAQATLAERILTAPYSLFVFLRTFFFPKELSVSQHFVVKDLSDIRFAVGVLSVMFAASTVFYLLKKKDRTGIFFIFWFFAFVVLVLNILFPLDMTFAERWLYFSMIGLLGVLGTIFLGFQKIVKKYFPLSAVLALSIVIILSLRTIIRNSDWKDGYTLYSRDIKISKSSFDLENNLGVELFRKGDIENAKGHFERSIELQPNWAISLNNLGAVYSRLKDTEKAGLYYKKAIEKADYYLAYENLALLLVKEPNSEKASNFLQEAVLKFPKNPKINIANAIVYYQLGKRDEALRFAARAVQFDPSPQNQFIYQTILSEKNLEFDEE